MLLSQTFANYEEEAHKQAHTKEKQHHNKKGS